MTRILESLASGRMEFDGFEVKATRGRQAGWVN